MVVGEVAPNHQADASGPRHAEIADGSMSRGKTGSNACNLEPRPWKYICEEQSAMEVNAVGTGSQAVTWLLSVWRISPESDVIDIMDRKWTANGHRIHLGEDVGATRGEL